MKEIYLKIDVFVEKLQVLICFFLFLGIVILGSIAVFSRFVFNLSIVWAEEMMRFACIWLVFIGSALTVRKDGHVSIDILHESLAHVPKIQTIVYVISRLVSVVFLICLFPAAMTLIQKTGNSMAASLPLSFSVVYAAVPIGIILMLWCYIRAIPEFAMKCLKGGEDK